MAIAQDKQRQGIGTKLLQATLKALKEEGIAKAALVVFKRNEKGNAFWEKQGFHIREDLYYRNQAISSINRIDIE